ncbi:MAG TPA: NUDIX domain-containing protein [Virgibacillus sp.]|nr:NUDIX domain-containing protein [Virgibacillus sp.]HLR68670.1 NUDIX domain-containing protein [Virgibacillus sp.]
MMPIKKAYGYITRVKEGKAQVLVFRHSITEAGIQIPKGTVKLGESTKSGVIREIKEETGLVDFDVEDLIAEDYWKNDDGTIHNRFFYRINISTAPDEWDHKPIGGGDETGLTFHFFWISSPDEVQLVRGHGDYLNIIFI